METKIDLVIELLEGIEADANTLKQRLRSIQSEIDELDQRFFSK
ncbi:hypothetical protein ACFOU2_07915 [Bacillus songklensis]|uniref:Uncharacterized protein n=1 Tax=Bacillus songklensis TaxID=1069116 RepID=A0ABV8B199_9BACI